MLKGYLAARSAKTSWEAPARDRIPYQRVVSSSGLEPANALPHKTSRVVCGGSLGQPCSLLAGEVGGFAALSFRSLLFAGSTVLL